MAVLLFVGIVLLAGYFMLLLARLDQIPRGKEKYRKLVWLAISLGWVGLWLAVSWNFRGLDPLAHKLAREYIAESLTALFSVGLIRWGFHQLYKGKAE